MTWRVELEEEEGAAAASTGAEEVRLVLRCIIPGMPYRLEGIEGECRCHIRRIIGTPERIRMRGGGELDLIFSVCHSG